MALHLFAYPSYLNGMLISRISLWPMFYAKQILLLHRANGGHNNDVQTVILNQLQKQRHHAVFPVSVNHLLNNENINIMAFLQCLYSWFGLIHFYLFFSLCMWHRMCMWFMMEWLIRIFLTYSMNTILG